MEELVEQLYRIVWAGDHSGYEEFWEAFARIDTSNGFDDPEVQNAQQTKFLARVLIATASKLLED